MRNRHGMLGALLALAVLLGNALLLPKLLDRAQALPEGQVVTQPGAASDGERVPLPTLPQGYGQPLTLLFSRPLDAQEQQIWDAAAREVLEEPHYVEDRAAVTYTQRVLGDLIEHNRTSFNENAFQKFQKKAKVGTGQPGTLQIDYGAVTVCLPDAQLTREAALPFARMLAPTAGEWANGTPFSDLDNLYSNVYFRFNWMEPRQEAHYLTTRDLTDEESLRWSRLKTEYLLSGQRPSVPLSTSETPDGALWFEESAATIHMPVDYELTDDELLQFIELTDSLTRQALLVKLPDMITQPQAEQLAAEWAGKLFGMDDDGLSEFASLHEVLFSSEQPVWRVQLGPQDMLVREQNADYEFEGCEIVLNAADGSLHMASLRRPQGGLKPSGKGQKKLEAELKKQAVDIVQALFAPGKQPKNTVINCYGYSSQDELREISCVVSLPGGVDHELSFDTADAALIYYRYWPDGCQNMG